jgi:hypothetical protein
VFVVLLKVNDVVDVPFIVTLNSPADSGIVAKLLSNVWLSGKVKTKAVCPAEAIKLSEP